LPLAPGRPRRTIRSTCSMETPGCSRTRRELAGPRRTAGQVTHIGWCSTCAPCCMWTGFGWLRYRR
jgi:hypothetical protein